MQSVFIHRQRIQHVLEAVQRDLKKMNSMSSEIIQEELRKMSIAQRIGFQYDRYLLN